MEIGTSSQALLIFIMLVLVLVLTRLHPIIFVQKRSRGHELQMTLKT